MTDKKYTLIITADASTFHSIEGALIQAHSYYEDMADDKARAELYADMPPELQPEEITDERRRFYAGERDKLGVTLDQIDAFLTANGINEVRA